MSFDPLLEPARSVGVIDDVAIGLDNVGIDPRGVASDPRRLPIGETYKADLAFGLESAEELDGLVEVPVPGTEVAVVKIVEIDPICVRSSDSDLASCRRICCGS